MTTIHSPKQVVTDWKYLSIVTDRSAEGKSDEQKPTGKEKNDRGSSKEYSSESGKCKHVKHITPGNSPISSQKKFKGMTKVGREFQTIVQFLMLVVVITKSDKTNLAGGWGEIFLLPIVDKDPHSRAFDALHPTF